MESNSVYNRLRTLTTLQLPSTHMKNHNTCSIRAQDTASQQWMMTNNVFPFRAQEYVENNQNALLERNLGHILISSGRPTGHCIYFAPYLRITLENEANFLTSKIPLNKFISITPGEIELHKEFTSVAPCRTNYEPYIEPYNSVTPLFDCSYTTQTSLRN